MTQPQKRAALYARVSTARQAQGQSVEDQLQRLQTEATSKNYLVTDMNTYRDDGWSGQKLNRPGLDRLRDHAAQAEFDVILITNPDRLARKYVHQMVLLEELERHGCHVEFTERPMSSDPHDQLLLQIRGAVAEYERILIAERMRRGRLNKIKAGTLMPWTKLPFGYRSDPNKPRDPTGIRLEASEAIWVERIFDWYLEPKGTLHNVSKRLEAAGVLTPTGLSHWNVASLRWILTNPIYTGNAYANRTQLVPATTRQSALKPVGPGNSYRFRPKDEWILLFTPAIITDQVFEQVQTKLALNKRFAARNNSVYEYLLRGLVSCGACQLSANARTVAGGYGYYLCRGRTDKARIKQGQRCRARFIPCDQLDALVWDDLKNVLLEPATMIAALERARAGAWLPQGLQAQQLKFVQAIKQVDAQDARLLEAYLAGVISLPVFEHQQAELERKRVALNGQVRELEALVRQRLELQVIADGLEGFCASVRSGLDAAGFLERRALIELLVDCVVVTGEVVEIRYAVPTSRDGPRVPFCQLRKDYLYQPSASSPSRNRCSTRWFRTDHVTPFELAIFELQTIPTHPNRCRRARQINPRAAHAELIEAFALNSRAITRHSSDHMKTKLGSAINKSATAKTRVSQSSNADPIGQGTFELLE